MKFIAVPREDNYDISKDPDAPKVGDIIPERGGGGVIRKVQRVSNIEMMKLVAENLKLEEGEGDPFDAALTINGKTFIVWKE